MEIWFDKKSQQLSFQCSNKEEEQKLDELLGFRNQRIPLSGDRWKPVSDGGPQVGEIGGHESQRWMIFFE